jgi:hypothetical protein
MQASLAFASTLLGLLAFWQTDQILWFAGACFIFSNWPYTLAIILPVNKRLQAGAGSGAESRGLVGLWARLHAIRTLLGALAVGVYLWALIT